MRRVPRPRVLAATVAAFVVTLGAFEALNGAAEPAPAPAPAASLPAITQRGNDELQRARETADPAHYARAQAAFSTALRRDPRSVDATVGLATLALARHDFRGGLRYAQRARRLGPELVGPYSVLVDAEVELGRYARAGRSLQRMIDLRPSLASYARVSYFRELHGDLAGATSAMSLAVSAGGGAPENVAYVQTLLGDLEAMRGRAGAARRAYAAALAGVAGYVPAVAGRAQLDAATGHLRRAIRGYEEIVRRRPLPQYVIALGEIQQVAGRRAQARETFALVDAERRLLAANGVNTDVEIALFESDHGEPRRGLDLARRAWRAAPGVRSADALSWSLTRAGHPTDGLAWARRALRLGSRDPLLLTRAGLTAKAARHDREARRYLRRALRLNPRFSAVWAPRARRALRGVR
jgi:tetratricopeptide (TPR) repeat protein